MSLSAEAQSSLPNNAVPPITVEVLTSAAELRAIACEWQALWRTDPNSTPFQHPEWLISWWEHVGEGDLHCLAARDDQGRLRGLLPLYKYDQPTSGERHLLLLGAGTSDYLDGLFHPEDEGVVTPVLLQHLAAAVSQNGAATTSASTRRGNSRLWDRSYLSQLRTSSPLLLHAQGAGWPTYDAEACSIVLVNRHDDLPGKLRANLNRYTRRARSDGPLGLHLASTPDEAAASLERLIRLHTRRWRGRGEAGVLASQRVQAHHRAAVPRLQAAGLLHMFELRLNGSALAVLYALRDQSRRTLSPDSDALFLYLIGFDPDYAELSPGSLLLSAVFDHCLSAAISRMDLLRGGEAYKQLWGAYTVPTFGISLPD